MLTEKQIQLRKSGLGGSDSAVLLGASPFITTRDIWADKMGLSVAKPPNNAMERGTYLEPVAAAKYSSQTGRKLQVASRTIFDKKNRLFFAHIDRKILGEPNGVAPLEIKCPGLRMFAKAKREGLPAYYQIQAQHYIMVMETRWASIAVFNAEQWELFSVDIKRDDEIIEMIRRKGEEFWSNHIETGVPPEAVKTEVVDLPAIGADQSLITLETDEWVKAVSDFREARLLRDAVEEIESTAKTNLIRLMDSSGASAIEGGGARIYYSEQQGRSSFDLKSFEKSHPELKEEIAKFKKFGKPFKTLRPFWLQKQLEQ